MRLVIENNSASPVQTPWPFRGEVAVGESKEIVLADRGMEVLSAMAFYRACDRMDGVTARLFRGTPEKEYEVVIKGAMPSFVEKQ